MDGWVVASRTKIPLGGFTVQEAAGRCIDPSPNFEHCLFKVSPACPRPFPPFKPGSHSMDHPKSDADRSE